MNDLVFRTELPPRACSSNGNKGSWRKKHAATAQYRYEVTVDVMNTLDGGRWQTDKARVSLVFGIKGGKKVMRYQPRDVTNALAAFKAGFDAMVDEELFPDDSRKHLALGTVSIDATVGPWVEVTVEAIE